MIDTSQISLPVKGMLLSQHQFVSDANSYAFALNALNSDRSGNEPLLQNEPSNVCAVRFPPDYQVVEFIEIPELKRTIYALTNTLTGGNQIGEVINCNYQDVTDRIEKVFCKDCPEYKGTEQTPLEQQEEQCYCDYSIIISAACLAFDVNYPVDIEYKITDCGVNIYFTDNLNERRFLYFKFTDNDPTQPLLVDDDFKICSTDDTCTCPDGYTYDTETEECVKVTITNITPSGDLRTACAAQDVVYGTFGVALYSAFNLDGTGTYTTQHIADTFWSNPGSNSDDGRLNYSGLWPCGAFSDPQSSPMLPLNENVGFLFTLDVPTTKTYYIGVAGDNKARIRIDCTTIMDMDPNALDVQYGGTGNAFKFWQIYPVSLSAGRHIIELTGVNFGSVAGFGAEVYDNTQAEIIAATGGAGLNILFSTHDRRGTLLQVSETFAGICPDGSCFDLDDDGNVICTLTETTEATCDDCRVAVCTEELDCEKIKFHSNFDEPCINFIDTVNGGDLREGIYQILIAYADVYGNPISRYFASSQTISIFDQQIKFETNNITNKAISFEINNLKNEGLFKYYNLVVAKTVDNFTEFIHVGTFNTTQTSYVYTGFEKAPKRLAPQEVFFLRPYYQKAKGVTTANNYLFFTGLTEYKTLNLQPVANAIHLQWETVAVKEKAYYDPRNVFYYRTFMRDEVYPMGIIFVYKNGRESCVFHIPGREATEDDVVEVNDEENSDIIEDIDCDNTVRNLKWQVYNTGSVVDGDYEYSDNCLVGKCWEYGDFAYWESTETYPHVPEIWGTFCGKPIRHHKFPDNCVTHIHDGLNGAKVYGDSNYVFPIGVRIENQSVELALNQAVVDQVITQTERDSIVSYRIVRGNRVGNKSIDAKGLIFNMWKYTRDDEDYWYANYPYNDLTDDYFLAPDDSTYDGSTTSDPTPSTYTGDDKRYTFHSPDIHFVNSGLGNILKVETEEYGESQGYFTHSECQAKHKFPSTAARAIALGFGVAAALSATGEKVCKVIEVTSDQHVVDFPVPRIMTTLTPFVHVNINPTATTPPVPGSPTSPTGGVFTPSPLAVGSAPAVSLDTGFYQTWYRNKYNTDSYDTYDHLTGTLIPGVSGITPAHSKKIETTCKGEAYQLVNANLLVNGILGFGGAGLGIIIQKVILGIVEAGKFLDTVKALLPFKNYSIQYNSVGKYNNYTCAEDGNKVRRIDKWAYLDPKIQNVDEPSTDPSDPFDTVKINNWERETSVYLKLNTSLANTSTTDNSRVTMDGASLGFDELDKNIYRDIASYYVSLKRFVPNQYGQLCTIEYLETNGCNFNVDATYTGCQLTVFGGDTFINRFALKRKLPFFLHTMCGVQDGTDVIYSELGNVAYPNYYFNTEQPFFERMGNLSISIGDLGATLQDIVGTNETRLDAKTAKFFYQNGYAHMFSYGIPYFFVESDINVDYRHGQNNKEKDFYPHNSDLKTWLEEKNVPIAEDNYYFYNRTYSKQNKESEMCVSCILTAKDLSCQDVHTNRLIYSEPTDTEHRNDNWLVFKANNFYDFPLRLGKLITADGIESDKVLARFEKGTQIFAAYNTIQATEENIQVGTGGLFQSRPKDIAVTGLGYAGTQHKDILHTEYGHIWADAASGHIFNLGNGGNGMDELGKNGARDWLKENAPFRILKDFSTISAEDIDNNLNGLGLHYCFDKRFNRFLITKLDYKKVYDGVLYDKANKRFYIIDADGQEVTVALTDTRYFCNKGWTLSYNVASKTWVSFHSYVPNFYVENLDTFDSAFTQKAATKDGIVSTQQLYTHNATNKSYQVFYGTLYPFIVEVQSKPNVFGSFLNNVDFNVDVIRYHNEFDAFYNQAKTFNKAIVYNNNQTSMLLTLKVSNPEDAGEAVNYPKRTQTGYEIIVKNNSGTWSFNDFWDATRSGFNNVPLFLYDCNNVNKQPNYKAVDGNKNDFDRAELRNKMLKIRFINDTESNYHYIMNYSQINQRQDIN